MSDRPPGGGNRTAVVLFNLGGPDCTDAVEPFLFNLFYDPAIITLPRPLRWLVAKLISRRRAPEAREIYSHMGGRSPILELTEAQAAMLEGVLADLGEVRAFVAMRYWHPMADRVAGAVKAFQPDRVVLLPLYPQYSTTTTGSSFDDWRRAAAACGLTAPTHSLCCYPCDDAFVAAHAAQIERVLGAAEAESAPQNTPVRVIFSAHGLPEKIIKGGDPYQWQVERCVGAIASRLNRPGLDWILAYQSRVGPMKWIGPATDAEIRRAGAEGRGLVVVPVAFVSEHSETLVELDIQYRELAGDAGVPFYYRVPALGTDEGFILSLAGLVRSAINGGGICSATGARLCPEDLRLCPLS